ncbi:type VII secretion integral membrane protein EccD [Saccharothrix australiensis]|uniref:Type VII secretion integral membrane protein EccD n=1 Tax=Saccharothrix australiensis TaxID=2072 RepID=A0A495W528_9PSEU|nr:type VII secretion integral membrane protein EccD [Saccharothrix australiensis]RKT56742.1 type VII secretion integral membrane protein EccD [Saccharothrix australiensis]
MTSALSGDLCRITVVGPGGRADLAVPTSTTVSDLLPVLVRHTADRRRPADVTGPVDTGDAGSWVLQRLGDAPFDADGTPESLDWVEGEQFHLRPAGDPLPELDFDDIADGMATAIARQRNHWRPEHARPLFLVLAGSAVAATLAVLLGGASPPAATIASGVLALLFAVASVGAGRWRGDWLLAALPGLAACAFAATAGLIGVAGSEPAQRWAPGTVVLAAVCATGVAGLLLGARYSVARDVPVVPFGVVAVGGVAVMVAGWLLVGVGLTPGQTAAVVSGAFFVVMIYSPRIAIRLARIRGPQLPKSADELQVDIDPLPAADVVARTGMADRYLNVITTTASLVYAVSFPHLLDLPGWVGVALPVVFTAALCLRARGFAGLLQRLAVIAAGAAGAVFVVLRLVDGAPVAFQVVAVVLLTLAVGVLALAATRPPTRRLLPIWGHLGNILETGTALALVPLLFQVLGVYAWARGLAG